MTLIQSLDHLHRLLSHSWSRGGVRPGQLSHSEYEYLRALQRLNGGQLANDGDEDHHGAHLNNLADILGVRKASASAAVAKLEKRGLVDRFPCQYDARAQHVVLTQKAEDALRYEAIVYEDLARKIEKVLSPEETTQLEVLLHRLREKL
ncbi:MarR family winged helix-turn-helix transcriptional regulator [Aestuariispira ectoiniformans]|uniref:MarR family winged helix-turn-helix transcriptional regulator n=1 Tax=Aestuariispira ectoiniformans TaxID=2775080 RepID=UPI00223B3502|nr:MarR family winged helix-turn-helix transcriptional regulator [Aestuariispira ectoiniformans]